MPGPEKTREIRTTKGLPLEATREFGLNEEFEMKIASTSFKL
jgi:hypothetical protein